MMQKAEIIGLTGGSGSGKSTAAKIMQEFGGMHIDADKIAHELMSPGSEILSQIKIEFGNDVFFADGSLNRKKLGDIVFGNTEKLNKLNKITHPSITAQIKQLINKNKGNYNFYVVDAAVLLQSEEMKKMCDKIVVVCADDKVRINRIMKRDDISYIAAKKRIDSQIPQHELSKYADIVLYNNGSINDLRRTISGCCQN